MSDAALELIAGNKETRDPFLDLGMCGLTELPSEIGELVWIESLSLAPRREEWNGEEWKTSEPIDTYSQEENEFVEGFLAAGIETLLRLKNLRRLYLSGLWVTDLVPLAQLTALETLDISNTPVIDLSPLAGLTSLRELNLKGNRITELAPLAALTGLQSLHLGSTRVSSVAPLVRLKALRALSLSKTRITDLSPLTNLTALQALSISETSVSDIAPLRRLTAMQKLDIFGTAINDLSPLASLINLQHLDVSHAPVSDLAPLADLSALHTLNVQNTQITHLAPLAGLTELRTLDVSTTNVTDLTPLAFLIKRGVPVRLRTRYKRNGIVVEDCPLTIPPLEIVDQGNEAILNYFRERESGVDHLYEAKMLILGEGGAGKTSLLRRLYQPDLPLPTEKETTKGIAIYRHEFSLKNGRRFRLNVWDFGGQEIYHATHQFFLTRRSLYLLVDDTRKDHKSVSDEGFKYWLELVDVFGGRSPVLIFQNEKGGRSKAIDIGGIRNRYENVKERYGGNLENSDAAAELSDAIEFYASGLILLCYKRSAPQIGQRVSCRRRKLTMRLRIEAMECGLCRPQAAGAPAWLEARRESGDG